jgi:hypothetical protein
MDRALCALAWASQAGIAATYLAVIRQPSVWRPMLAQDAFSTVCLWVFLAGMALLWVDGLWLEQKRFYNRSLQRLYRRGGLVGHLSLFVVAMVAASKTPNPTGLWIALPVLSFMAIVMWFAWMHTQFLPAEDQAVVDAITDRNAKQRATLRDATARELRHSRLTGIVSHLGYQLTAPATQDDAGPVRWNIPAGKHAPVVYFIRNGNRVKIGTTTELKRRIRTLALRTENVVLLLDGGKPLERQHHNRFADLRIGNTEWFAYEGALVDYVHTQTAHLTREDEPK